MSATREVNVSPIGITGANLCIEGEQVVEFSLHDRTFRHPFYVCFLPMDADGLVGMDLLMKLKAQLDLDSLTFEVRQRTKPVQESDDYGPTRRANHMAFTVFMVQGGPRKCRVQSVRMSGSDSQQEAVMILRPHKINLKESEAWIVKTTEMLRLAPRTKQMVMASVDFPKHRQKPQLVCVEPAQLPVEGVLVARALSRTVQKPAPQTLKLQAMMVMMSVDSQLSQSSPHVYVHVMMTNFAHEEIVLPKSTAVRLDEEISEALLAAINAEKTPLVGPGARHPPQNEIDPEFRKYVEEKLAQLIQDDRQVKEPILLKYQHVFHDKTHNDFKGTDLVKHRIV
jgi:hypothetical protein